MTYIAWALYVEGPTDSEYLKVLIPRLIGHLLRGSNGALTTVPELPAHIFGIPRLDLDRIASRVCEGRDAFHILFVHGDTGGRALADQLPNRTCALCRRIEENCGFPRSRCVVAAPNREIEAWTLADISALRRVFGLSANASVRSLPTAPTEVESLRDPKRVTQDFLQSIQRGTRNRKTRWPFELIAQEQEINLLLQVPSFARFSAALRDALRGLGHPDI
ncbi:uncharacterized protein DUF4276 [Cereibacter johrii]|uniref:Uncharacterized protein DUF4276 n=1 Tax=Cereibacter johrii TaxID=445629 RepID=A0ABX5J611_9RHOB|nr:uncharacterized protein DUF4276 [Cereibacter johrii]